LEEQFPIGRELVWLHRECRRFYTPSAAVDTAAYTAAAAAADDNQRSH
jgi:hypothetical protein